MKIFKLYKTAKNWGEIKAQYPDVVKNPFLVFFFTKYEPEMPWGRVNSVEDMINIIKDELIPALKTRIDPEANDNLYIKDIDIEDEMARVMIEVNARTLADLPWADGTPEHRVGAAAPPRSPGGSGRARRRRP